MRIILILLFFTTTTIFSQNNKELQELAKEFFKWRTATQPITPDDIPRVERPDGWIPDYSPESIISYKSKYEEFRKKLHAVSAEDFNRADSVDFLLLRSAIERVNWELNILKLPHTHPEFYIQQTVGSIFDLLVIASPFDQNRADNFILRLKSIPKTIVGAKKNLTNPLKPFAQIAISQLEGVRRKLSDAAKSLKTSFPDLFGKNLFVGIDNAASALEDYSGWLKDNLPGMSSDFTVGRENFIYFLKNIALVPYSPEELLRMGRREWERAVTFETLEIIRNKSIPQPKIFNTIEEQIEKAKIDEQAIRDFLVEKDVLTIPATTNHYTLREMPPYVMALNSFGELDDFTSPTRLDENSVRYIPEPSKDLPYFYKTAATDPRPLIIHEGTPGHYFQLVQAWNNPDYIRRFYFDSNGNEGVGFYLEEMLLQLGLYDDKPRTREIIYSFMRLRALRVDIDINLALGNYTIEDAAQYLASTVPMDYESAAEGAAFYALTPGQAITYQIGKIQIVNLISEAKVKYGNEFSLKNYHDYMMKNGNMPIALHRWEYLGETDEIKKLW